MHIEKSKNLKIVCEITHATEKQYLHGLMGSAIGKKKLQINKNYISLDLPGHGEFGNLCFVSVAQRVSCDACLFMMWQTSTKLSPSLDKNHLHT